MTSFLIEAPDPSDGDGPLALLKENAVRIFSEPDAGRRLEALAEIWAPDGVLVEAEGIAKGYEEIAASVGGLLDVLPPGTSFVPDGQPAGHHGLARMRWRTASADGAIGPVSGTDVAIFEKGRIRTLYVIIDPGT